MEGCPGGPQPALAVADGRFRHHFGRSGARFPRPPWAGRTGQRGVSCPQAGTAGGNRAPVVPQRSGFSNVGTDCRQARFFIWRIMITVYFGTGGAEKTSVAAATAFARARAGLKCLLLTGGAAAPLGAALGLKGVAHEHRVAVDGAGRGELWTALLDTRATLDEAVGLYAVPRDRDRILRHPIYRALPDSLPGLTELMTIERIDQARRRGFENIVIDTAPSRQALSLLDKPVLFVEFAGSNWVKLIGR